MILLTASEYTKKTDSLSPHCRNHSESWFCFRANGIAIFIGRFWVFMLATCRLEEEKQHKSTWQNSKIHWLNEEHVFSSFCQNSIRYVFVFVPFFLNSSTWEIRFMWKYVQIQYDGTFYDIYLFFFPWKTIRNCMRKPEKTSQIIHISGSNNVGWQNIRFKLKMMMKNKMQPIEEIYSPRYAIWWCPIHFPRSE